ncbi:MAG: hypothetical protein Q8S44_06295 [Flavobacteriaceae bacterium]|nr:hypothetical protein [Flavobacteriaceae bacterium]
MKVRSILIIALTIITIKLQAQHKFQPFENLLGNWKGTGAGFSNNTSTIMSSFQFTLNQQYIEVKNESVFKPTEKNPTGEVHQDWGFISFDKQRKLFVFRQFHIEGFVNQYIFNQAISTPEKLVFESEIIENFVPGGKARWTIIINNENAIETIFDLQMPGKEFVCYGTNKLEKLN